MCKEVVIIGAGGHGKVIADIIKKSGDRLIGFLDDCCTAEKILDYPVLGKIKDCLKYRDKEFFIAIGNNAVRKKISEQYNMLKYYTAIHPSSVIAMDVEIGEGSCVMAGTVINTSAKIGKHCIINSGSVVEHDNKLADFVHLSPGAILCGTVSVGEGTHIGGGVTVKNNTNITGDTVIGVGAAVVKDIDISGVYCGVPASIIK